jgi:hypothetical protein
MNHLSSYCLLKQNQDNKNKMHFGAVRDVSGDGSGLLEGDDDALFKELVVDKCHFQTGRMVLR